MTNEDEVCGPMVAFEEAPVERVRIPVTAALLEEIEAKALAASAGPWACDESGVWTTRSGGNITDALLPGDPADGIARVGDPYARGDNCPTENMLHIARMDPETALSVVARLRLLEEFYLATEAIQDDNRPRSANAWDRFHAARKAMHNA